MRFLPPSDVIKVIRENGSGAFTVQAFLSHPWVCRVTGMNLRTALTFARIQVQKNNYMDQLLRNRASIKHHLVLTDDGVVAPMAPDSAPR